MIHEEDNALLQLSVGSNNGILYTDINENIGVQLNALGFRTTDQMLYGMNPLSHELYRIDANGAAEIIASPLVDPSLAYFAGDVTPDGNSLVIIGSINGIDEKLLTINLASGNYEVEEREFNNGTVTVDIGFHPLTSVMYGFDAEEKRFYTHNLGATTINTMESIFFEHNIQGFYFDAFGNMYGFGTALFGVISGLFNVEQSTGETSLISTSGLFPITDMAGCPYSLEIDNKVSPGVTFPCSDITIEYTFANQTGDVIQDVLLEHELPSGYTFYEPSSIPFGGILDNTSPENLLRIEDLSIPMGIHTYSIEAYVDDIPKDIYKSQATLNNVPQEYGSIIISNDPISPATEDSTLMEVNRIEEDSLSFNSFLCLGNSLTLDASDYGSNLTWNNGSTTQQINVFSTGIYTLIAESGCEELFVSYDVVSASCPYTIEIRHVVEPDTLIGCSEVVFSYILDNDSGEDRYDVIVFDTLPNGFTFLEVLRNPYVSELSADLPPNVFQLENLLLHGGIDTIDVLVEVGEVSPGTIRNKAFLKGLSQGLGATRSSDDPNTNIYLDSTTFFVKGVEGGSIEIDTFLCLEEELSLDVTIFGDDYLWDNGSTDHQLTTSETGNYHVLILNGCDTGSVTFYVEEADPIQVEFPVNSYEIDQSESIELETLISNLGDSLSIDWNDELTNSLSCLDCPRPIAVPLSDIIYTVYVENEYCADSAFIEVFVDETRQIFSPNAFSPNADGINDYFYLQSPHPATILSFQIFDRWGVLIYDIKNIPLNQAQMGWDGRIKGQIAQNGVYVWQAEIQFFDGKKEGWSGDVMVIY